MSEKESTVPKKTVLDWALGAGLVCLLAAATFVLFWLMENHPEAIEPGFWLVIVCVMVWASANAVAVWRQGSAPTPETPPSES